MQVTANLLRIQVVINKRHVCDNGDFVQNWQRDGCRLLHKRRTGVDGEMAENGMVCVLRYQYVLRAKQEVVPYLSPHRGGSEPQKRLTKEFKK